MRSREVKGEREYSHDNKREERKKANQKEREKERKRETKKDSHLCAEKHRWNQCDRIWRNFATLAKY